MKLKTVWLSGVAAAALLVGAAAPRLAEAAPIPPALSYAELLEPVPDAHDRLAADDALREQAVRLELAQYWYQNNHHHHHHHHHHHSWRWYRDNGYYWNGGGWAPVPYAHHHHHSWQWYQGRGYDWNGWAWTPRQRYHHHHHHHHHHHQWQ